MDIQGKVAIVTGAASGIGRATAMALAEAGAAVVLADVDDAGGAETLRQIEAGQGRAAFVHIDVSKHEEAERMVAFALDTFGRLDILHNNAGINAGWPAFPDTPPERWLDTIAVNLSAVIAGTQAAIPVMRRGGGCIVNSASLAGLVAYGADPIYAATKHAVVGFTRALASLRDSANIRVNCVCPGFVDTPLPRRRLAEMPEAERLKWEKLLAQIPMIPASEVAAAVLELIRDESLAGEAMAVQYGKPRELVPPPMRLL